VVEVGLQGTGFKVEIVSWVSSGKPMLSTSLPVGRLALLPPKLDLKDALLSLSWR